MWSRPLHWKHSITLHAGCKRDGLPRVATSFSNRRARASTALARPPFHEAALSTVLRRPCLISVTLSASCRAFMRVAGSRRRSSQWRSLDARLDIKRTTSFPSDFPALLPTSATFQPGT
ncbi:hypothetical protein T09_5180 [Trichinella sp. T9]|nr:hypothetical protein T09_5180 [Trichinella sp. T9]